MENYVIINDAWLEELLNTPEGPVGVKLGEMSERMTAVAKAAAPVMKPENRSHWGKMYDPAFQYGDPDALKVKTRQHFPGYTRAGKIFGGTDAPFAQTFFLNRPVRNWSTGRPIEANRFLFEALDTAEL